MRGRQNFRKISRKFRQNFGKISGAQNFKKTTTLHMVHFVSVSYSFKNHFKFHMVPVSVCKPSLLELAILTLKYTYLLTYLLSVVHVFKITVKFHHRSLLLTFERWPRFVITFHRHVVVFIFCVVSDQDVNIAVDWL